MEYVLHYDTSSSIGIIILVCVPEKQVRRIAKLTRSYPLTDARETRHSHDIMMH